MLVINATTVNTGHAWQFTPTWMGESPWAVHEEADSIPRLEWSWYYREQQLADRAGSRRGRVGLRARCVCADEIDGAYKDIHVQLVDGGVHDNQGTVALLAHDCNVLLVSDACGQLAARKEPRRRVGAPAYAKRSMDTLMERMRLANYARSRGAPARGLLRGLMFLHMKAGLDAETIRLPFSQEVV